jgi:hypothetical protein
MTTVVIGNLISAFIENRYHALIDPPVDFSDHWNGKNPVDYTDEREWRYPITCNSCLNACSCRVGRWRGDDRNGE